MHTKGMGRSVSVCVFSQRFFFFYLFFLELFYSDTYVSSWLEPTCSVYIHSFTTLAMDSQHLRKQMSQHLARMEEGHAGFCGLVTWYDRSTWGCLKYGSEDQFKQKYIRFTVQKLKRYKNGRMDFSLVFPALKNKVVSFSKAMFEIDPLCLEYYVFDDKDLPAGCEIIEKVPTSREMFYNNPKKRPAVCIEPAQSEIVAVGKESALEIEQSSKKTAAQQKEVTTDLENKSVCIPQSEASLMVHRSALEVIQQYTDEFRSPPGG